MTEPATAASAPAFALQLAEPVTRQVTRALRHAIVTMRIRPGEMISEQEIATRYGVSRSGSGTPGCCGSFRSAARWW